jgi:hypothetical protein
MRELEFIHVLRTSAARTGWLESRSGRLPAQNTELPRPRFGERGSRLEFHKICQNGGVDGVNRFSLGLGRTSARLARIAYILWSSQRLQGLECGSSPTSGTTFSLVRGDFALTC